MHFPVAHQTGLGSCIDDNLTIKRILCGCQPWAEEGIALLEKAAGQGHAYAMNMLGGIHCVRKEQERALEWHIQGAEAGLPVAKLMLGCFLDEGWGMSAPDYAAAGWYRGAADAGNGSAALNLYNMYTVGRGWAGQIMPASSYSASLTLVTRLARCHVTWRALSAWP